MQRQLAAKLGISQATVHRLIGELDYRCVCAKWVPNLLTAEMKRNRKEMSHQLLDPYWNEGEDFLKNLITRDESWVTHYDPEYKKVSKNTIIAPLLITKRSEVKEQPVNLCY